MNHSLEGSCQCGEVHYQIKGEPLVLYRCHCTECQKQSGSGFGMSMWVRNDDFEILRGSLKHSKGLPKAEERWNVSFATIVGSESITRR